MERKRGRAFRPCRAGLHAELLVLHRPGRQCHLGWEGQRHRADQPGERLAFVDVVLWQRPDVEIVGQRVEDSHFDAVITFADSLGLLGMGSTSFAMPLGSKPAAF